MTNKSPGFSRLAAFVIGVLCISPFAVAFDLVTPVMPDFPAFHTMRAGSPLAKAAWIALGPFGIVTICALIRRPMLGFVLSIVFAAGTYFAGLALWQQLLGGVWMAVAASLFAAIGAWQARSNNSFKPKPLRGSA